MELYRKFRPTKLEDELDYRSDGCRCRSITHGPKLVWKGENKKWQL